MRKIDPPDLKVIGDALRKVIWSDPSFQILVKMAEKMCKID